MSPEGQQAWDNLPHEVLANMFSRVPGPVTRKSARSVCRRWREAHGLSVRHVHPSALDTDKILKWFPFTTSLDLRRRTRGDHPEGILEALAPLTRLRNLNLDSCREATDTELTALRPLSSLTSLVLSHCWWLKGPGLSALAHLTGLRTLSLSSSDISCDGLDAVAALPSLTSLDLNFCWRLSDAGLSLLRPSTVLRHLGIAGTAVRDGGAQVVASMPGLVSLDMGGCEITDVGAQLLSSCTTLERLSIPQSLVTDNGLAFLANLPLLTDLNLTQCALVTGSGPGLAALAASQSLACIRLKGCPLGGMGLDVVRDLSKNPAKAVIR